MSAPGTLLAITDQVTASATRSGALQSIPTEVISVWDENQEFSIRIVRHQARKMAVAQNLPNSTGPAAGRNPFLPFDPQLFVADIPPAHVCLLNKFNVMERHLLLVTREFRPQTSPLSQGDFTALASIMAEANGVAFYNSGVEAGASQPHRHFQWIPVAPDQLPLAAAFAGRLHDPDFRLFPFKHAFEVLPKVEFSAVETAGAVMKAAYQHAMTTLHLVPESISLDGTDSGGRGSELPRSEVVFPPYNLIVTRQWLLMVPRLCESVSGISLNSLAFVGALLVRDEAQLATLRELGPWRALQAVTVPQGVSAGT